MPPPRENVGYAPVKTVSRASTDDSDTEAGETASMYAPDPPDDAGGGEGFNQYIQSRSRSLLYAAAALFIVLVLLLAGSGSGGADGSTATIVGEGVAVVHASCALRPTTQSELGSGLSSGTLYLTYTPGLGTDVEVEGLGMSPGKHGIHIHELGDL
eukprot:COSAG02_NODE_18935_length_909_cov_1.464198_1_plen_155_part_10